MSSRGWRRRWRRWRRTHSILPIVAVIAAAVVVAIFAGFVVWSADGREVDASDAAPLPTQPAERALVVIGDSWTTGGEMNQGPTWPAMLDLPDNWTVLTDAVGGSGYIGDAPELGLRPSGRLDALLKDYIPDVALVALGRNDIQHYPQDVIPKARDALSAMRRAWPDAKIVVFSPFSPGEPDPSTATLTAEFAHLSKSLGLDYLDVSGLIGADADTLIVDEHPNDEGQRAVAEGISAGLVDLGVFE